VSTDTHSTGQPADRTSAGGGSADGDSTGAVTQISAFDGDAPETASERRLVNLLIIGIILLVFGVAFWLGDALLDARRMDDCIASGRRNCAPITVPPPPPR
jgi:hypothetical protein